MQRMKESVKNCGKRLWSMVLVSMVALLLCVAMAPLKAEAGEVKSGSLGSNGGILWTYDYDSKTLTLTGEDSGMGARGCVSLFKYNFGDLEKVVIKDCKIKGSVNYLFSCLYCLKTVEIDNFDTSEITYMDYMFENCSSLTDLDLGSFNTSQVKDMSNMFSGCKNLTNLNVSGFDTSNVTNMSHMFDGCGSLESLDVSNFDTSKVTDMSNMFYGCWQMKSLDVSNFDTSEITNMNYMFKGCSSLADLDLSSFNTSQVKDMSNMFSGCKSLTNLDMNGFDTSNVTNMNYMFEECKSLESLDVSTFDTSQVTVMSHMFANCSSLSNLDVSCFNTSNVTSMSGMFYYCSNLTDLDLSGFDTSQVVDVGHMFYECNSLKQLDVSNFDTSQVSNTRYMFCGCKSLESLDINNFDMSQVTKYDMMFYGCNLKCIFTPKVMAEGQSIELFGTFYNSKGNKTAVLTVDFCNDRLTDKTLENNDLFLDAPTDSWYYAYVKAVYDNGYMTGTSKDVYGRVTFMPATNIPREQFVQVLYAMDPSDKSGITCSGRFTDVRSTDWFAKAVEWAASNGIVSGVGNGRFGVGEEITREQMALMLLGYANLMGYETSGRADISGYPDIDEVSSWAKDAMGWAVQYGIMKGKAMPGGNCLAPKAKATRAECATMIMAFVGQYE